MTPELDVKAICLKAQKQRGHLINLFMGLAEERQVDLDLDTIAAAIDVPIVRLAQEIVKGAAASKGTPRHKRFWRRFRKWRDRRIRRWIRDHIDDVFD